MTSIYCLYKPRVSVQAKSACTKWIGIFFTIKICAKFSLRVYNIKESFYFLTFTSSLLRWQIIRIEKIRVSTNTGGIVNHYWKVDAVWILNNALKHNGKGCLTYVSVKSKSSLLMTASQIFDLIPFKIKWARPSPLITLYSHTFYFMKRNLLKVSWITCIVWNLWPISMRGYTHKLTQFWFAFQYNFAL